MVIQRWQSVLLLAAAILMAVFTFCSLGQIQTPDFSFNITTLGISYEGMATDGAPSGYAAHTWEFFIVSLMCVILPLIAVFMYRNLKRQRTLCLVSILFIIADIAIGCVRGYTTIEGGVPSWSSMIIAPFLSVFAIIMAWKLIGRDQRLLSSADRIR